MEPLPASYYGAIEARNPVMATFQTEVKQLLGFLRKLQRESSGDTRREEHRRGSHTLFHIWVKYKPRLPVWYYQEKLLKVGDSLVQIREYKLALFQCYGRYLEQFCSVNIDDITSVEIFKSTFFPNGTDDKNASLTFHALQGRCICIYHLAQISDPNLRNQESVKKCLSILSFLRLIMQVVLPQEHLCWLVYNGTIHIYTICRHLMVLGHSSQAVEFLIWASMCMESSVPLMSVRYLKWRTTLYTAVCQCYYDCRVGVHGEVFARRAISKINELSQLENMSDSSCNEDAKKAFKESTLKMAVMIFKRAVFESRRKPKGLLRPKLKNNLKDAEKLPWPRTNTERLLVEMFSNNAAQFLAIVEALTDSNRRMLQAGPPEPDEPEIHDVIAELFFAGTDILSGGGVKSERCNQVNFNSELGKLSKLHNNCSLLELALDEKDAVSAESVVKFTKLAFSYEHWDTFDTLISPLHKFLQTQEDKRWKKEEMDLRILIAAEPLLSGKKPSHVFLASEGQRNAPDIPDYLEMVGLKGKSVENKNTDDHITLAEMLFSCTCDSLQDMQSNRDIVIDVILLLWQKCKAGVQRMHTGAVDGSKFVQKCEMSSKWIYILCLLYEVMQRTNIIDTDAVILGEAALRLAGIAENLADTALKSGRTSDNLPHCKILEKPERMGLDSEFGYQESLVKRLMFAYQILDKAVQGLSVSRSQASDANQGLVVDHYIAMLGVKRQSENKKAVEKSRSSKSLVNNMTMMDLQLELIVAQHRVSVKILNLLQVDGEQPRSAKNPNQTFHTESEILDKINKNCLSKAIFLMQKAVLFRKQHGNTSFKLLEESEKLIQQAEVEEKAVFMSCVKQPEKSGNITVPPQPILVHRTENSMLFKPAPFKSDVKVAWYCLFGRIVAGPSSKVRLNDYHLPGTGEEVPAHGNNLLEVRGLNKNEKYVFAVAAFSEDGHPIGDGIGESTKPILAFLPQSVLATWAYLAQSAYHIGNYKVARKACSVLWNYFVLPSTDLALSKSSNSYICQMRLCREAISNASPILLQLFLGSIFIWSDLNIKEGALFCDSLSDGGVLHKGQIGRIAECERLLVALDVSILLNDANYALQAVVQCYGLIAPLIYHRIPSVPVVQILVKCLAVLQEIPSSTWQKKQAGVTEGVLHMTACIVYYVAKVLRSWHEYELAISLIDTGKKLLNATEKMPSNVQSYPSKPAGSDDMEKTMDGKEKGKGAFSKKQQKKKPILADKVNEQLTALEQNLLQLNKPVMKLKRKSRFLEFFVQLLQRVLSEEKYQKVLEWTTTVFDYLKRRNENVLGTKLNDETDHVPPPNDSFRRYTTAVVEYHKGQPESNVKQTRKVAKKVEKVKNLDLHKLSGEELEKKAFTVLTTLLTPIVARYRKCKRIMQTIIEEMPWRAQTNLILAQTHFALCKKKLSQLGSEELACMQSNSSYRILDPELFTLHHAGTVVMTTETKAVDEQVSSPGHLHPSLKLDLPLDAKLTESVEYSEASTKRSDADTPRTQMTNDTETSARTIKEQAELNMSSVILFEHLKKVFDHLKKAMVLAHRGRHWTLLQNSSRTLWNIVLELQLSTKEFDATKGFCPITKDLLYNEIWMPFFYAADFILDMIFVLQNAGSLKVLDVDQKFIVPSCMGGIADEEGGSSLNFENPLDDVTVIDMRFSCDLVLKALEILYHVKRWEALVHLAIHFNILTHERFTEQVTPLLVHAQRTLAGQIHELNGLDNSVINGMLDDREKRIHCRNYLEKQLYVGTVCNKARNPGDDIDRRECIVHSGWKVQTRVPLDVMDTFACFHDSLQKSKFSSRALKHSRKLLTLFLAYGQDKNTHEHLSNMHTSYAKVGFSAGALQAHRAVPPDLLEEKFLSVYSVENKPIPPSHLSVVIASYDKTIEIFHSERQQSLKAQALHELGNLHLYAGNKRAAFKCWCRALDETLNMSDALNSWQELDSSPEETNSARSKDYIERFLSRAGIWGCLLAAVIASKMSRYILTSNVKKRTNCCLLSALLFKSLFYVSLPHPEEDLDYALYEIGEGCEVSELIPGIDLFSDRHRADVNTVVSSLGFLISELNLVAHNLMVLPLLSLYQYFVSTICRDPVKSVEGRLLKIKVLTDMHLFAESFHEISLLNCGGRIPRRPLEGFFPTGKPLANVKFLSSKTLLCSENLKVIDEVLNRKPNTCLHSMSKVTMNKLVLAKTHFILKLSSTINAIPEVMKKSCNGTGKSTTLQDGDASVHLALIQDLTLIQLKDILLNEAESRVKSVLQDIEMKCHGQFSVCSAVELETVIESKLQLSEIARQRHHSAVSVAMALSALKTLQEAKIFTVKPLSDNDSLAHSEFTPRKDKMSNQGIIQPCDSEAKERLNMHTWLQCRLALVTALVQQIHGIAIHDQDILDVSALITKGIVESETLCDYEAQAQFMLQAAYLDIQEGHSKQGVQLLIQNIIHLLQERPYISPVAQLTLAQSLMLSADLMENNEDQPLFWSKQLNIFTSIHKLVTKHLACLGENLEYDIMNPSLSPLKNIYLPHTSLLAKVRMRIGHILSLQVCHAPSSPSSLSLLLPSFNLYNTALQLCKMSAFREYNVEAELQFLKGRIEHQMFLLGDKEKCGAIKSFSEAINVSKNYDHNFSLIKKSYLEIALVNLYLSRQHTDKSDTTATPVKIPETVTTGQKVNKAVKNGDENMLSPLEFYRMLAWLAIRAATQIREMIREEMATVSTRTTAELLGEMKELGGRMSQLENHIGDATLILEEHEQEIEQLHDLVRTLQSQHKDLENRCRRKNLRFRGLPESMENVRDSITAFIQELIPSTMLERLELERAHRALTSRKPEGPPRDIIVKFLYFQTKEDILKASREKAPLTFQGRQVQASTIRELRERFKQLGLNLPDQTPERGSQLPAQHDSYKGGCEEQAPADNCVRLFRIPSSSQLEVAQERFQPVEIIPLLLVLDYKRFFNVGEAMLAYKRLTGESSVANQMISPEIYQCLPSFARMDLLANLKDFFPADWFYSGHQGRIGWAQTPFTDTSSLDLCPFTISHCHFLSILCNGEGLTYLSSAFPPALDHSSQASGRPSSKSLKTTASQQKVMMTAESDIRRGSKCLHIKFSSTVLCIQAPDHTLQFDGQTFSGKQEDKRNNVITGELTWVHIIRYHNHLKRLKNMLTGLSGKKDGNVMAGDTMYTPIFDYGITACYAQMHLFLKKYLPSYSTCCVIDFPSQLLWGLEHKSLPFHVPSKAGRVSGKPSSSISSDGEVHNEQMATCALDEELCLQWYSLPTESLQQTITKVLLLYSYNGQNMNAREPEKLAVAELGCGYLSISLPQVLSLHEKLCTLWHQAEFFLQPATDISVPGSMEKQRRPTHTAKEKPDVKPLVITEELQEMILECCSEAQCLLSSASKLQPITQAPFDITLPSLIRLERVFDLTHGCMVMKGSLLDWLVSLFT
ncbi:cilia- and flagella-associated protein 54 [Gastrophryne carolinensis]